MERTANGNRRLKMWPVMDECTRECPFMEIERFIIVRNLVKAPAELFELRGEPSFICSDNGREIVACTVKRWLEVSGVETLYIELGFP
jgi:putative transposase